MNLGFWNFYKAFNANRMFDDESCTAGDDLFYGSVYLARRLRDMGHQVATLDMDKLENFDAAVFIDHPTFLNRHYRRLRRMPGKKLYLILAENEANRPDNYWPRNHRAFDKVFTWDPTLADQKKIWQFWHTVKIPSPFSIDVTEKTKFCVTISSQKFLSHPKALYAERVDIIRWFEREHPEQFDLYGARWDRLYFSGFLSRLNYVLHPFYTKFPNSFRVRRYPSYRGAVPYKKAVMRHYKFAIVYENAIFPGYLSEKIFDAFFAGCVPVYLGAPDVLNYLPAETFIDRREFPNNADLYRYLSGMSQKEYLGKISAIEAFVNSERIKPFSADNLVDIFLRHIVNG